MIIRMIIKRNIAIISLINYSIRYTSNFITNATAYSEYNLSQFLLGTLNIIISTSCFCFHGKTDQILPNANHYVWESGLLRGGQWSGR